MQPASTVMVSFSGSIERMRLRRATETTSSGTAPAPVARGTEPPQRLVLPACGTTDTPCFAHRATTRDTSSVFAGRTAPMPVPGNTRRQSVKKGAVSAGSVSTCWVPTMDARSWKNAGRARSGCGLEAMPVLSQQ